MSNDFWSTLNKKKREELLKTAQTKDSSSNREEITTGDFWSVLNEDKKRELLGTTTDIAPTRTFMQDDDDIAPVKGGNKNSVFKSGGFSDGVDGVGDFFGDLGQTVLGTTADLGLGILKGAGRLVEGVVDLGTYGVAGVADLFGADKFAEKTKKVAQYSATDEWTKGATDYVDQYSVLGNKADMVSEGIGQVGAIILTGGAAGAAGLGTAGATALTTGLTGLSGMGSGMNEAYEMGASDGSAVAYGATVGSLEAVSEMIFGGLGKGFKALGVSKGLTSIDDVFAKKMSNAAAKFITSEAGQRVVGNTLEYAVKSGAEGLEEVISGFGSAIAKDAYLMNGEDEKAFGEILKDENLLEQFVVGSIVSGIAQGGDFISSTKNGRDFVSGLSKNEQTVVDKVFEQRLAEESENRTLSNRDKNKLYERVVEEMKRGYVTTDEIESILGGETYKGYKDLTDKKNSLEERKKAIEEEIKSLVKTPESQFTIEQREKLTSLREEAKGIKEALQNLGIKTAKNNLFNEVNKLTAKDTFLRESYNDLERQKQALQIDENQYNGTKFADAAKKTIENARKAKASNSIRVRDFVEFSAKYSSVSGTVVDFKDANQINKILEDQLNAKIATLQKSTTAEDKAKLAQVQEMLKDVQDGKIHVNGVKTKDGVAINIKSPNYLNVVLGHEVTHFLEGKNAYEPLQKAIFKYAQHKGDLEGRRSVLEALYENIDGTSVDYELTADLVGDYLFTEYDFIKNLSTEDRNVFQKVYDQIKYMFKLATAGSKEARELEKVMHQFEKALRESAETSQNAEHNEVTTDNAKYSISVDSKGNELSPAVQKRFEKSKAVDENGDLKVLYHGTASGEFFTFDKAKGSVEGDFGSGFYFTDNEYDVERNYEDGGPDFDNKVARRAEQIEAEEDIEYSEAEARAREELYVGGKKFEVYLNIENPCIVGETNLFDYDRYASEYDPEDYDSEEDYEGDVEQLIADDIDQIVWDIERNVDVYNMDGVAEVLWNAVNEGGIDAEQLKANINNLYLEDSNGNMVGNEVTRQIIESLGYDGIIDNTVSHKFSNMGLSEDTTHYIVFKPNQIKDISNQNPTDNPDIRYSLSKSPLDNSTDLGYNVNDDLKRGDGYVRTVEFRKLQAESQRMSDEDIQLYHSGNRKIDEGLRANLARVLRGQIHAYRNGLRNDDGILSLSNEGNEFNMCKSVNGSLFHDCFEISQKYLRNGELVDLHGVKTTEDGIGYDDCDNYLSEDGLSGFSITPDGDLISVFNASGKGGFLSAIAPVVRENAKTLDCYNSPNQPLCKMYEKKFGFKTASVMDYNMEYDHDNIAANHNKPKVAFMVNTASDVETKYFSEIEYDKAKTYRDSFVNQTTDGDIAPVGNFSLSNESEKRTPGGSYRFDGKDFRTPANETALEQDIAPVAEGVANNATVPKSTRIADGTRGDELLAESLDNYPMQTIEQKVAEKIRATEGELADNRDLRKEADANYESQIAKLRAEYNSKKNKNTKVAYGLLQSISRLERLKASTDAQFAKRISDLEARVDKMKEPKYTRAMRRQAKMAEHAKFAADLLGDTSTWKDKKLGLQYATNTERRNLRDIVRDANGNADIAKADAIDDALNGQYNRDEAAKKRELSKVRDKYAKLKITKAEDAYIQMLGEFRHNPDTTLTEKDISEYYEKHKSQIDAKKVDKVIELARQDYDSWLNRVNAELKKQGMKEIPYRQGYFPHFTEPKQNFIQKLLNWKTQDNEIPTSIAGLTETFKPTKSWQSFDKTRHSDKTDYSFMKGFDAYSNGVLDWIYHLDTIQKRRAVENHIRSTHSDEGITKRIKEVYANEEYDANEAQAQIEQILSEANNPLNNFVQDFMTHTNILTNKKNSLDRTTEQMTNRNIYTVMQNVQNRTSANMVLANVRSALTNVIPITQSWAQVSPLRSLQATKDTIANAIKDDGLINKSTFLTNRLREADNLYKTNWDKVLDKAGIMFEIVDNFSSQVIWRSKYNQNLSNGMSEAEAIANADQFAENVMAGRSKGNEPTLFNAKNPIVKAFTMFQLEVNNQYGYLFKDVPNDLKAETNHWKLNLAKGYTTAFIGAYVYNALLEKVAGSGAALDPIGIIEELLKDLGLFDDDEEEGLTKEGLTKAGLNLADNVIKEIPIVGNIAGGGRIPISSALPYADNGFFGGIEAFVNDVSEGNKSSIDKELQKPFYNLLMPVGGGQLKKTIEGLSMFNTDEEHPIAGSYTTSGNLRFPVEDTLGNKIQAGIFGQYASKNAREYFDNDYAPLKEKQIQEYMDVDLPIGDYWKYREGLKGLKTQAEKADYVNSLDIADWQKNLLMNNILDRKEDVDMSNYDDYSDWEEFDYAQKNPDKYAFAKSVGGYSAYKTYSDELYDIKADKDEYGKSISGSRKEKVLNYINNLDADYETKIILWKSEYPSDDTYNMDIINYLNNRADLTYEERVAILTELGFTVSGDTVYWD